MIRVGIAARPPLARGLKRFVEAQASMELIAVAEDEAELANTLEDEAESIDVVMKEWRVRGKRDSVASDTLETGSQLPTSNLTPREIEVLGALAEGASNKEIARRLGISFHTAKFHVAAILEKLDATTRTEAVTRAARLGIMMI